MVHGWWSIPPEDLGVLTQAAGTVWALTPTNQRVQSCPEHQIFRLPCRGLWPVVVGVEAARNRSRSSLLISMPQIMEDIVLLVQLVPFRCVHERIAKQSRLSNASIGPTEKVTCGTDVGNLRVGIHLENGLLCSVEFAVPQWSLMRHASSSASVCKIARGFGR